MKNLLCTLAALGAICAPFNAYAADLGGYEERETYVERPARIIERERIVEHRYYEPRYYEPRHYDEPEVYYAPRPRVYRYYAGGYPYYYEPRFYHRRHHQWRGHDRW